MPKLEIDQETCIGCGLCASICPSAFELGDDGKAHIKNLEGCEDCDCNSAEESCPVNAITYEE